MPEMSTALVREILALLSEGKRTYYTLYGEGALRFLLARVEELEKALVQVSTKAASVIRSVHEALEGGDDD